MLKRAFRIFLIFFFFGFQFLHHLAMPITMHFGFVFIYTVLNKLRRVNVIIQNYNAFAESLCNKGH